MVDFEQRAINYFSSCFPNSSIKVCYFHLIQSFWRKINEHSDIKFRYGHDENFEMMIKMLPSLVFLPPIDVVTGYAELRTDLFFIENGGFLQPFYRYFHRTYIGQIHGRDVVFQSIFSIQT
ncbi:hypothetical protein RF11_14037 [Thelohanellus kitauei]|uniref:MULE transposase domain-containing protein n=1 Tax=Thelohanellus kitauei TaxID=669202 RepID=A0A0C2MMP8_THEKT|nr:hypothetical protein RF11_14037 [Thelohanellus kitauei]